MQWLEIVPIILGRDMHRQSCNLASWWESSCVRIPGESSFCIALRIFPCSSGLGHSHGHQDRVQSDQCRSGLSVCSIIIGLLILHVLSRIYQIPQYKPPLPTWVNSLEVRIDEKGAHILGRTLWDLERSDRCSVWIPGQWLSDRPRAAEILLFDGRIGCGWTVQVQWTRQQMYLW